MYLSTKTKGIFVKGREELFTETAQWTVYLKRDDREIIHTNLNLPFNPEKDNFFDCPLIIPDEGPVNRKVKILAVDAFMKNITVTDQV